MKCYNRAVRSLVILLIPAFFAACSLRTAAVRTAADVMRNGAQATQDEPDLTLGREGLASQLKLVEGLLVSDRDNPELRLLAAEGFSGYAFLFLEEAEPERAKGFYQRGVNHAWAIFCPNGCKSQPMWSWTQEAFDRWLGKREKKDVPALFWLAFGAAGRANLSRDSSEEVAKLPRIAAMMKRVHELDKEFQFAGADLFFGTYYASRPALLGGDKAKAKLHFEWARRLTSGRYLMAYVLEARYLAVALQDKEMFERLLKRVVASEQAGGPLPGARLTDEAAKKKAAALLEKADDYF
jgi:hypothetical protein